jgi:hypothetical protein
MYGVKHDIMENEGKIEEKEGWNIFGREQCNLM